MDVFEDIKKLVRNTRGLDDWSVKKAMDFLVDEVERLRKIEDVLLKNVKISDDGGATVFNIAKVVKTAIDNPRPGSKS